MDGSEPPSDASEMDTNMKASNEANRDLNIKKAVHVGVRSTQQSLMVYSAKWNWGTLARSSRALPSCPETMASAKGVRPSLLVMLVLADTFNSSDMVC